MEILKDKIKEFLALDTGSGYGRGGEQMVQVLALAMVWAVV